MRVRDFVEVPLPILVVQRAEPEGVEIKSTKSGRTRRVPIADRVLPLVRAMAADRDADARLFVTESGHQLHAKAFKRTLAWTTIAEGRRIHDLDTRPRACGWRAELILQPCRRGWGTLRSRPRTFICTTSEPLLMGLVWSAERPGAQRGPHPSQEPKNHKHESRTCT
jgi:hypothetical protein